MQQPFHLAQLGDGVVGHGAFLLEALRTQFAAAAASDTEQQPTAVAALMGGFPQLLLKIPQHDGKEMLLGVERIQRSCYPPQHAISDDDKDRLLHMTGLKTSEAVHSKSTALPLLVSLHDSSVCLVQQTEVGGHNVALVIESSGALQIWSFVALHGKTVRIKDAKPTPSQPSWMRLAKLQLKDFLPSTAAGSTVIDAHWEGTTILVALRDGGEASAASLFAVPFTLDIGHGSGKVSADISVDDALPLVAGGGGSFPLLPCLDSNCAGGKVFMPGRQGVWAVGAKTVLLWTRDASGPEQAPITPANCVSTGMGALLAPLGAASPSSVLSYSAHPETGELLMLVGEGGQVVSLSSTNSSSSIAPSSLQQQADGAGPVVARVVSKLERLPTLLASAAAAGACAVSVQMQAHRQLIVLLVSSSASSSSQLLLLYDAASGLLMQAFDLDGRLPGATSSTSSRSRGASGAYRLWCSGTSGPVSIGVAAPTSLLTLLEPPIEVYAQRLAARLTSSSSSSSPLALTSSKAGSGTSAAERALASRALCSFLCRQYSCDASEASSSSIAGHSLPLTHWAVRYAIEWAFTHLASGSGSSASGSGSGDVLTYSAGSAQAPSFPTIVALAQQLWGQVTSASPALALLFSSASGALPDSEAAIRLLVPLLRVLGVRRWAIRQALQGRPVVATDVMGRTGGAGGVTSGLVALASPEEILAPVLQRARAAAGVAVAPTALSALHMTPRKHGVQAPSDAAAGGAGGARRRQSVDRHASSSSAAPAAAVPAASAAVSRRGSQISLGTDGGGEASAEDEDGSGGVDTDWVLQMLGKPSSGGAGGGGGGGGSPSGLPPPVPKESNSRRHPMSLGALDLTSADGGDDVSGGGSGKAMMMKPRDRGVSGSSASGGGTGKGGMTSGDKGGNGGADSDDAWEEPLAPQFLRFLTPHNMALAPLLLECLRLHAIIHILTSPSYAEEHRLTSLLDAPSPPATAGDVSDGLKAAHAFLQLQPSSSAGASPGNRSAAMGAGDAALLLHLLPLTAPQPSAAALASALAHLRQPAHDDTDGSGVGNADVTLADVHWHAQGVALDGVRATVLRKLGVVGHAHHNHQQNPSQSPVGISKGIDGGDDEDADGAKATQPSSHQVHAHPALHSSLLQQEASISLPLDAVPAGSVTPAAGTASSASSSVQAQSAPAAVTPAAAPALELVTRLLYTGSHRDKRRIAALARRIEASLPPAAKTRLPPSLASYLHVTEEDSSRAAELRRQEGRGVRSAAMRALLALPPDALLAASPDQLMTSHPTGGAEAGDSDDGVPGSVLPHVQLLLQLGRGADALRVLLRAGCWGAGLAMLERAEEEDAFFVGRDPHPLSSIISSASNPSSSAVSTTAGDAAESVRTLSDLAASDGLTVPGLGAVLLRHSAAGGAGGTGGGTSGGAAGAGDYTSGNNIPYAPSAGFSSSRPPLPRQPTLGGGSSGEGADAAAARRLQNSRQTSTLGMATATASALRWSRQATTRVTYFHILFTHVLRLGDAAKLCSLWQRLPEAYTLPTVLATLRSSLAADDAESKAAGLPTSSLLPALEVLSRQHCKDMEEQARFWRQQGSVRKVDTVLREWGSAN